MKIKLKWKVEPAPIGPYRSFEERAWPTAYYSNGEFAGYIHCVDEYRPAQVRTGEHAELEVWVNRYDNPGPNVRLKARFKTLAEAKQGLLDFVIKYPLFRPKELQ